jgi:hypothetical protein
VAVIAYPTIGPNSGNTHRIVLDMNPAVRGRMLNVSMALAIVGEVCMRSRTSTSGGSEPGMRASTETRRRVLA